MSNSYPDSAWYRTGDVRIAPGWFGFMQAQELWRRDSYDSYGETTGYVTKWKSTGPVPPEVDSNFYSAMAARENNDWFVWKKLISYFPGLGIKDPVPSSPSETQERMRNYQRKTEDEQRVEDGYAPDPLIIAVAAKRDPEYAERLRIILGHPWDGVTIKTDSQPYYNQSVNGKVKGGASDGPAQV